MSLRIANFLTETTLSLSSRKMCLYFYIFLKGRPFRLLSKPVRHPAVPKRMTMSTNRWYAVSTSLLSLMCLIVFSRGTLEYHCTCAIIGCTWAFAAHVKWRRLDTCCLLVDGEIRPCSQLLLLTNFALLMSPLAGARFEGDMEANAALGAKEWRESWTMLSDVKRYRVISFTRSKQKPCLLKSLCTCFIQVFLGATRWTFHPLGVVLHNKLFGIRGAAILFTWPNHLSLRFRILDSVVGWLQQDFIYFETRAKSSFKSLSYILVCNPIPKWDVWYSPEEPHFEGL